VAQRVLRKLRFTDFMTTAQDGDKVVSLTHRPPLPPGNTPVTTGKRGKFLYFKSKVLTCTLHSSLVFVED